jgi:hypothetical protein
MTYKVLYLIILLEGYWDHLEIAVENTVGISPVRSEDENEEDGRVKYGKKLTTVIYTG